MYKLYSLLASLLLIELKSLETFILHPVLGETSMAMHSSPLPIRSWLFEKIGFGWNNKWLLA